jgi:hypothetical protein
MIKPVSFQSTHYKTIKVFYIIYYQYFTFKSFCFEINLIPLPWTCHMVFMREFMDPGSAKKFGVLTRAAINFSSGKENQTRLRVSDKARSDSRYVFACECEIRIGYYDPVS